MQLSYLALHICSQLVAVAVIWRCSIKKMFLRNSQNSYEKTCAGASYLMIKLQTVRTPIFLNLCKWLYLYHSCSHKVVHIVVIYSLVVQRVQLYKDHTLKIQISTPGAYNFFGFYRGRLLNFWEVTLARKREIDLIVLGRYLATRQKQKIHSCKDFR